MIEINKDCVTVKENDNYYQIEFSALTDDDKRMIIGEIASDVILDLEDVDDKSLLKEIKSRFDPEDLVEAEVYDMKHTWHI